MTIESVQLIKSIECNQRRLDDLQKQIDAYGEYLRKSDADAKAFIARCDETGGNYPGGIEAMERDIVACFPRFDR
jgi:hypothetical protein